eukprot:6184638-Pleurochrysis_carterae.AAC.3
MEKARISETETRRKMRVASTLAGTEARCRSHRDDARALSMCGLACSSHAEEDDKNVAANTRSSGKDSNICHDSTKLRIASRANGDYNKDGMEIIARMNRFHLSQGWLDSAHYNDG